MEFRAPQEGISTMAEKLSDAKKYEEAYRFIYNSWNNTMSSSENTASNE
jgi:hypothetical protein